MIEVTLDGGTPFLMIWVQLWAQLKPRQLLSPCVGHKLDQTPFLSQCNIDNIAEIKNNQDM